MNENCSTPSCKPVVLGARDPPPKYDSDRPCISFTTAKAPTEKKDFRTFSPMGEPFESLSGVTGERTGRSGFIIGEDSVKKVGLWGNITGDLTTIIRSLTVVVMIHYLQLMFGNSVSP